MAVPKPSLPVNVLVHIILHTLQVHHEQTRNELRDACRLFAPELYNKTNFMAACDRATGANWAHRLQNEGRPSVFRVTTKGQLATVWDPTA